MRVVQQLQIMDHKQDLVDQEQSIGKHQLKHLVLQQYLEKDIFVTRQVEVLQSYYLHHHHLAILLP
ncbi:MAG: hypothetical protein CMJ17_14285 [Phenylobacterium sp.]|nr:hypothetical protein [Phenylobacterium sp.]